MRCSRVLILSAVIGVVLALPQPAAATTKDEALASCKKRGSSECKSYGLGTDGSDVVICVDNRSSGHGIQCVHCKGDKPCSVLRSVPGDKTPDVPEVEGVLTDSVQPADTRALEQRIRSLEERLKALEQTRK